LKIIKLDKAFSFNKIEITIKIDKFVASEIVFSTENGLQFGAVIVHIPNQYTTSQEQSTNVHNALKRYSEERARDNNVILACYLGDTNYKKVMQANSNPSFGGNQGGNHLSPASSPAKKHTDYMQAISLTQSQRVMVNQPSTLNLVKIADNKQLTPFKTDHPSIQVIIQLDNPVKGKPKKKNPVRRGFFQPRIRKELDEISVSSPVESLSNKLCNKP
jgi:hypothetical protein